MEKKELNSCAEAGVKGRNDKANATNIGRLMGKACEGMRYYPAFGVKSGLIALIRRFLVA